MNDLKINGLNKYWSVRFLVLSFIFIGCLSLANIAYINGVKKLRGMTLVGLDLRSSAALIIAALTSKSVSYVYGLEHLDRGYENFEQKLSKLGIEIKRQIIKRTISESNYDNSNSNNKEVSEIKAA